MDTKDHRLANQEISTESQWLERATELDFFIDTHLRAPRTFWARPRERSLARWHINQRRAYNEGRMSTDRSWRYVYATRFIEGD
jgi:hypothetical protein